MGIKPSRVLSRIHLQRLDQCAAFLPSVHTMLAKLLTLTTFAAVAFGQLIPKFPEGYFYIKSNATGKVLDVFNLSLEV